MSLDNYPEKYHRLKSLLTDLRDETPNTINGFTQLHQRSMEDGVLSRKTKELMALAIAIHSNCVECIAYHVHDALKAGASRNEIVESVGVAVMMGGGPAIMSGCEALEAVDQFEESQYFRSREKSQWL